MCPNPEVDVQLRYDNAGPFLPLFGVVVCVTLLPLYLSPLGFDFAASAHGSGWAAAGVQLRFDVVTLALVLFTGIATRIHMHIAPRREVLMLGTALVVAGLTVGIHVVPDTVSDPAFTVLLGRGGTALIIFGVALVVHARFRGRYRSWVAGILATSLPVVAAVWLMPLLVAPDRWVIGPTVIGATTLVLQVATGAVLVRMVRQERLHYFGRGLLMGLLPLAAGQLTLIAMPVANAVNGQAIATLLQWFAWALPAIGLGIDVLKADQEKNLNAEKRFLRAVVDAIPHFIFARDTEGRYTLVNEAVAGAFGKPVDEIEGRTLSEVHETYEDCRAWLEEDRETLRRGATWSYPEQLVNHSTGETVHLHSIKKPLLGDGDEADQILGVSIDVTDRLRAERALAERLELERANAAILTAFVGCTGDDEDLAVEEVLTRVCTFTGAQRCYIYRVGDDGRPAERLFAKVAPAATGRPLPPPELANEDLHWAANWLAVNAPIDAGGSAEWPPGSESFRRRFELSETASLLLLPVARRGRPFGFISVDRTDGAPWRRDTMAMLRNVGDLFITVWEKLETERTLVRTMEAARASSRSKTEFLANMSHEIRTPMNCIIGIADLLREMEPSERQLEYLEMVRQAGGSLLTILNDILDISRIEAGKLQLDPVRTDLRTVIEDVVGLIAFAAQSRGLEVVCRLAPGLPAHAVLDGGRLRQVLTNLLNNAAKFTRRGHIYLDVEQVGDEDGTARLRFRVTDTGIGIPGEQMSRIFEKFTQAEAGTTRRFGGTGLGLAISRQLVELMGGELAARSVPDQGSTFTFTIPVSGPEPLALPAVGTSGDNVLIIAGHELAGEVLVEQVRQLGYTANMVTEGADALDLLAAAPSRGQDAWRAVLVDQTLPAADLRGIVDHCSGMDPARRPRVLIMSDLATLMRDIDGQVDGFLTKPVRLERLAGALNPVPVAPAAAPLIAPEDRAPGIEELEGTRILLAEDNPFNQQVAVALLDRLGCTVTVANNGAEAVEKVEAMQFDLVFMDCQMPEMDGYEATRRIRALAAPVNTVPIVAMTANALSGDRESCFAAGMDDFLSKPITRDMLVAILKRVGLIKSPV